MKKYKVDMHVPKDIYEISKVFHDIINQFILLVVRLEIS